MSVLYASEVMYDDTQTLAEFLETVSTSTTVAAADVVTTDDLQFVSATEKTAWDAKLDSDDISSLATITYVDSAISALVDSAPETLNTLNEIAAALGDDSDLSATLTAAIAEKPDMTLITSTFSSGSTTKTISLSSILEAKSTVTVYPQTDPVGAWTIEVSDGSFTITSDATETADVSIIAEVRTSNIDVVSA